MDEARPTIALCIPAYNAARFLPRLLESARAQTTAFDEVLVYDDASTDETAKIAASLGAVVIRGIVNAGCSRGKNILAATTRCDWIHFHDADDVLKSEFVARARLWTSVDKKADVVLFSYLAINDDSEAELYVKNFDGDLLRSDPVAYCLIEQINPFCGLYRRTAFLKVGGWNENPQVLASEDQAGHLRMALGGLRFDYDPTVTIVNRIRNGSMTTGNPQRCPRADLAFLEESFPSVEQRLHPLLAQRLWKIAGAAGAFLDWETAYKAVALARRIDPQTVYMGSRAFCIIAKRCPHFALKLRERWVRLTRPTLRNHSAHHPYRRHKALWKTVSVAE